MADTLKIPSLPPKSKLISLSQGRYAIVSEQDFDRVNQHAWSYHASDNYAIRLEQRGDKRVTVELHRFVLGDEGEKAEIVDHINGNKLDCRRENLRPTDNRNNQRNRGKQENSTSGLKGVSWSKEKGKWSAQIQLDGTLNHLGYFDSRLEAGRAYNEAARELFGEYAQYNDLSDVKD